MKENTEMKVSEKVQIIAAFISLCSVLIMLFATIQARKSVNSSAISAASSKIAAEAAKEQTKITRSLFEFQKGERQKPIRGSIRYIYHNLYSYFDIEWNKSYTKIENIIPKEPVLKYSKKLKEFQEGPAIFSFDKTEHTKEHDKIFEEFFEEMKKISENIDGHFHLAVSLSITNPRDVPVTITRISPDFISNLRKVHTKGEEYRIILFSSPFAYGGEPEEIYQTTAERTKTSLYVPFDIPAKKSIIIHVSFTDHSSVLEWVNKSDNIEELDRNLRNFWEVISLAGIVVDYEESTEPKVINDIIPIGRIYQEDIWKMKGIPLY